MYSSPHSEHSQLLPYESHKLDLHRPGEVGWRVETEPIGVLNTAYWGGPPALPCSGMTTGAAAPALGSVLVLAREGVEGVGNLALGVGGSHSGSTSLQFNIPWQNVPIFRKHCRSLKVARWVVGLHERCCLSNDSQEAFGTALAVGSFLGYPPSS